MTHRARKLATWRIGAEAKTIGTATLVGLITISLYLVIVLVTVWHRPAISLFQWDASNALGPRAFDGGLRSASIGLLMDIPVTLAWAWLYVALARRNSALLKHPTISGAVYGGFVLAVMFGIVVPIGHAAQSAMTMPAFLNTLTAHVVFFGIPVAWTTTLFMRRAANISDGPRTLRAAVR